MTAPDTHRPELAEWLLEQVAADEVAARAAANGRVFLYPAVLSTHFARHDPARVLAECAAKRAIVALHAPDHLEPDTCAVCASHAETYPCRTLQALAAVYAD